MTAITEQASLSLKDTYNQIAEEWAESHAQDTWWIPSTSQFASMLPTGATVLDLGCGVGGKTKFLTDWCLNVSGLDFSERMIEVSRERYPSLKFGVQDIYKLEKIKERFDGVFLQAVLLHFPKAHVLGILQKIAQLINPNGLFYVAVKELVAGQPDEVIKSEEIKGQKFERFFSNFTEAELTGLLQDAGFAVKWSNKAAGMHTSRWIELIGQKL